MRRRRSGSFGVRRSATVAPVAPLERLSSLLVLERRTAEARTVLRQLFTVTRNPPHLVDSILISQIESEVHDLSPEIEKFLHQTPDDPWLRRVWGLFLLSRGRSAEALPHLEAAALALGNDPLGRFALAECRMALGISGVDLSLLGTPPSRGVDAARWWVLRSRLAQAWGREDEALESLRKAVTANPRNVEAHYRLGQTLIRRGDRDGARVHLDRAQALGALEDRLRRELRRLVRERFDAHALLQIGRLCGEAGMIIEARDWFELAIQRNPRSRPWGLDLSPISPTDEGPAVALSRPVLKASAVPLAPIALPGSQLGPPPVPGSRRLRSGRESGFATMRGPRPTSSSATPWVAASPCSTSMTMVGSIFTSSMVVPCPLIGNAPLGRTSYIATGVTGPLRIAPSGPGSPGEATGWAVPWVISTTTGTMTCS